MPKTKVKERYDITAKEEIIEERRVRNGTMTAMNKPDEFDDDDVDEMKIVMKPGVRKSLRFKIPDAGQLKFGIKMEK